MAITQDRLIRLLDIIDSLHQRHRALKRFIEQQQPRLGMATTVDDAIQVYQELVHATYGATNLTEEEYKGFVRELEHFKLSASKNKIAARNARNFRLRIRMREKDLDNQTALLNIFEQTTRAWPSVSSTQELRFEPEHELLHGPTTRDAIKMIAELPGPETQPTFRGTDEEYEEEIAKPIAKTRNPMLDQITLDFIYTRLKLIQEQTGEGPTPSDIANLYRKGGADEDEVQERTQFWISELTERGLIERTAIPHQYKVLDP